jgi:hypothetical protein
MSSNAVSAIHHLRMAEEHYQDFIREMPKSRGAILFQSYIKKIRWIYSDIISYPYLNDEARDGIKKEIESDVFAVPAINDKISLLNPEQRELIENTIDALLAGEEVKIVDIKEL